MESLFELRDIDGAPKLMLRFPLAATKGAGLALSSAMAEEGFFVEGSRSAPWHFESIASDVEDAYLVGPDAFRSAATDHQAREPWPSSLDAAEDLPDGMLGLLAAARAFSALLSENKLQRGLVSSGIIVAREPSRVLVLPPSAVAMALAARGAEARSSAAARLSSPRSQGPEDDASFLLAQAAYRYATGVGAFPKEASEPGTLAGSLRGSPPAALAAPRLDPALAGLIEAALEDPGKVSLAHWIEALEAREDGGWTRELGLEEEKILAKKRKAYEADSRARQTRAHFFSKYRALMIGVAIAAVALAAVGIDIARANSEKPNFSKLSPIELVGQYYKAIDGLDLESIEACGGSKAIGADRDTVMDLVVVTKTRTAYEGKNPVLPAKDWIASGKRPLQASDFLYGIVDLDIRAEAEVPAAPETFSVRASYSMWSVAVDEDPSGDMSKTEYLPAEQNRVDELVLERGKKGWQIISLKRTQLH